MRSNTLILALACTDGVVIGTDSASSDSVSGTKQPVLKVHQVGTLPILCGGSGDGGLIQKIHEHLESEGQKLIGTKFKNTRQKIKLAMLGELRAAKTDHVPQAPPFHEPPTATFLFACVQDKFPFILEVEIDGRDTLYDKNLGSFAAIGSGKGLAQALIRSHLPINCDLETGKVLGYRVLEDAIELAAAFLATPIHLYTINLQGEVKKVGDEERATISSTCELWRSMEREALGKALAPSSQSTIPPTMPEPEDEAEAGDSAST